MKTGENVAGAVAENKPPRRISIVDDDASIRAALQSLMRSVQFDAKPSLRRRSSWNPNGPTILRVSSSTFNCRA